MPMSLQGGQLPYVIEVGLLLCGKPSDILREEPELEWYGQQYGVSRPHALRVVHEPYRVHDGVLRLVCETGNEEPGRQIRKRFVEISGTCIFEQCVVKMASVMTLWKRHIISLGRFRDWQSTEGQRERG